MAFDPSVPAYAGIDLGASSGRVIVGQLKDGMIELHEVYRFVNHQKIVDGHDCWDVEMIFDEFVRGLAAVKNELGIVPASIGVDTFGSDYVLLDEKDQVCAPAVSNRDARVDGMPELAASLVDPAEAYARTGAKRMFFNTNFQLLGLKSDRPDQLAAARTLLMIPDYINFLLTGVKACEYTNSTLTALVDPRTGQWDDGLVEAYGLPRDILLPISKPGRVLGHLRPEVAERVGYDAPVVLTATHDTASAMLAVPVHGNAVLLSSGTWSIIGCHNQEPVTTPQALADGISIEGAFDGGFLFMRFIMGLWMCQSVRREVNGVRYVEGRAARQAMFDHEVGFGELADMAAEAEPFEAYVDPDDERFKQPDSMIGEIKAACADAGQPVPETLGQVMRTIYCSLSRTYAEAAAQLSDLTGVTYDAVSIVGGGSQDAYLNRMTATATGLPVFAGPVESTCIGNLVEQMLVAGVLPSVDAARAAIECSFPITRFEPEPRP